MNPFTQKVIQKIDEFLDSWYIMNDLPVYPVSKNNLTLQSDVDETHQSVEDIEHDQQ
ncbi:hypothetical protein MM5_181 [Morganella phage vB_Mm5]